MAREQTRANTQNSLPVYLKFIPSTYAWYYSGNTETRMRFFYDAGITLISGFLRLNLTKWYILILLC